MSVARVLGVDAAGKSGWVAALVEGSEPIQLRVGSLADLIVWAEPVQIIAVDIPVGSTPDGRRRCDDDARRHVGRRRSSVFAAPPSEILEAESYAAANSQLSMKGSPKVSRQAWALVTKIREAAAVAAMDPRIYEVHPEVSFRQMAGEELTWSKKSWNGLMHRRALLAEQGIVVPDVIDDAGWVVADDVVDACAAAWSARRIASGVAGSFPDPPEQHGGRRVAIWY